ncbi:MAG: type II toxin-antitoxin system VapC family toxin [Dehalococcoidia bacterium]|nr:type II toxin-antitoxin system VapC family toxin [Dehalococcoidia bacterium]
MPQKPGLAVVDASVVLKWQLDDEEYLPQATALRNDFYALGAIKAIAPHLLACAVINGILTATRRKRLDPDKALEAVDNLMSLGVELREVDPRMVSVLALKYNLSAYDAAYLALAESEGCELWTGDRPFYRAVKSELPRVKWIGDYVPVS